MPRGRGVNASGGCRHMTCPAAWPEQWKQKEKCKAAKKQSSLQDVSTHTLFPRPAAQSKWLEHKLATHCAVQAPGRRRRASSAVPHCGRETMCAHRSSQTQQQRRSAHVVGCESHCRLKLEVSSLSHGALQRRKKGLPLLFPSCSMTWTPKGQSRRRGHTECTAPEPGPMSAMP